ncbi:MAG: fumarylacetoacetate hydrolase family protein [Rhodobacteraceae bacterium]|nr:fumarylacetoacetate hydrolase family protein [Paracoccaceae bacterium]
MDLFPAPAIPRLTVLNSDDTIPVNRVFCVGRNYWAHAAEMNGEVERDAPFYFTKSHHAVVGGGEIPFPPGTENYHHEFELSFVLGTGGKDIDADDAISHIWGWCAGLDMTRRDLQNYAKEKRLPWDTSKDIPAGAVLGPVTPAADWTLGTQRMHLSVNGEIRQDAHVNELIWSVPEIIAHLSRLYTLTPGDVVMTGTPAGVGPVGPGDVLEGEIDGLAPIKTTIGAPT